jgi:hypothetical protein
LAAQPPLIRAGRPYVISMGVQGGRVSLLRCRRATARSNPCPAGHPSETHRIALYRVRPEEERMLPVLPDVLKRLRLEEAIADEAQSWQSLVPSAPGSDRVVANSANSFTGLRTSSVLDCQFRPRSSSQLVRHRSASGRSRCGVR